MERTNLYTLIHDLSDGYDYIALGDTSHTNETVRDLRGDLDLFRVVKDAGYNAFTLEKPPEDMIMNDIVGAQIDALTDKTPEEFYKEKIENGSDPVHLVGAFAEHAFDMTPIYPDPRYSDRLSLELSRVYSVVGEAPRHECGDVFLQAHWKSDPEAADYFEEEVFKGDDIIAERTADGSGGRAFIIYGNSHFTGENDLNEMLGADRVAHIAAIESRERGYRYTSDSPGEEIDTPDYIYVIDEDAVIPFDFSDPQIIQILENFKSSNVGYLDQQTFDECTDALPESLREHAVTQQEYEQEQASVTIIPIPK